MYKWQTMNKDSSSCTQRNIMPIRNCNFESLLVGSWREVEVVIFIDQLLFHLINKISLFSILTRIWATLRTFGCLFCTIESSRDGCVQHKPTRFQQDSFYEWVDSKSTPKADTEFPLFVHPEKHPRLLSARNSHLIPTMLPWAIFQLSDNVTQPEND